MARLHTPSRVPHMCLQPTLSHRAQGRIAAGWGALGTTSPSFYHLWLDMFWQTTLDTLCLAPFFCNWHGWGEVRAQVPWTLERQRRPPAKKHQISSSPPGSVFKSRGLGLVWFPPCLGSYQSPSRTWFLFPGVPVTLWYVVALRDTWFPQGKYQLKGNNKWYMVNYCRD